MDVVLHVQETKQSANDNARLDDISKELTSNHPDLIGKMKDQGWNLLHCSSFAGREDFVAQILSVNPNLADEGTTTDENLTALSIAIDGKHESVVLRIVEMCPSQASKVDSDGNTVLHLAASKGFRAVVEHLLASNPAMVNVVTNRGGTALHSAAHSGDSTVFSLVLAANPALIDATTNDGRTVLHFAASEGHVTLVSSILTKNATLINAVTNHGCTAMHYAAENNHLSVVKLLHTVSPELIHVATAEYLNVAHYAINQGHSTLALYLLTEAPTLINAANNRLQTPLHFAASRGLTEVVAHILGVLTTQGKGVLSARGWSPLHEAAFSGQIAVVEQLLAAYPALIDAATPDGRTALHSAAASGESAMVSYLLRVKPASADALTNNGRTVFFFAAFAGDSQSEICESLLATKPELIAVKDNKGILLLHILVEYCRSRELLEQMWRLYPEALHAANSDNNTPFHTAVAHSNHCAIELFQWELTWEEIESAYAKCKESYVERFKPVMETQCEELTKVLLPDVAETVFEYLGFERVKRATLL